MNKLPISLEAEKGCVGGALLERGAMLEALPFFNPEHYTDLTCKTAVEAILQLEKQGKQTDLITVAQKATSLNPLVKAYDITCLTDRVHTGANIKQHLDIVINLWVKRQLPQLGVDLAQLGMSTASNSLEDIATISKRIQDLSNFEGQKKAKTLAELAQEHAILSEKIIKGEIVQGFKVRLNKVNILQPWGKGHLVILAARPGMGKTASSLQLAMDFCKDGYKGAVLSLEMPEIELFNRMVANESGIELECVKKANFSESQNTKYVDALGELAKLNLIIDDTPSLTPLNLKNKIRILKEDQGLDFLIVDYLQLMSGDGDFKNNRVNEISYISRQLKEIAKEFDILLIALSQLSRAVESRGGDKKPMLSDLRDSGSIEQDADCVVFLYRPEYYGIECYEDGESAKNVIEFIFSKNRHGELGIAKQMCDLSIQRIYNITDEFIAPQTPESYALPMQNDINSNLF